LRTIAIVIVIAACGGDKQETAPPAPAPAPIAIDAKPAARGVRGDGSNIPSMGRAPKIDEPSPVVDAGAPSHATIGEGRAFEATSLTLDMVKAKIASVYMAGLKRCYKETLKRDPKAHGNVALKLEVNTSGRVVSPTAVGFDDEMASCIQQQMGSWRFAVPKEDDEATEASFQLAIVFATD